MAEEKKTRAAKAAAEKAEEKTSAAAEAEEEKEPEKTELQKAQDEIAELRDKYLRTAAEFDNFRKRTAREKEMLFGDAVGAALASFLTVYDNLERAVANPTTDENYKKGVELTFAQFCDILGKMKVETIDPQGKKFDPNFHNAVMHEENKDFEENTVCEVFQKGFKLGDRVIRPALVKVAN